jgi:hypothetical protein
MSWGAEIGAYVLVIGTLAFLYGVPWSLSTIASKLEAIRVELTRHRDK